MVKILAAGLAVMLLATADTLVAQPVPPPPGALPVPVQAQRREEAQAELLRMMVQRISADLGLDANARSRLLTFLEAGEAARRELARESLVIEQQLQRALSDPSTPESRISALIEGMVAMRERELTLWRQEQASLREFLTPRQHAALLAFRNRFNRTVQDVVQQQRRPPGR